MIYFLAIAQLVEWWNVDRTNCYISLTGLIMDIYIYIYWSSRQRHSPSVDSNHEVLHISLNINNSFVGF